MHQTRLDHILQQISPDKLKRKYSQLVSTQPLADLPCALDLLSRMLRLEWQGEAARLSARDALAHEFFDADVVVPVTPTCDKEQRRRFAGVRKRLQQLHEVRCWSLSLACCCC